MRERISLIDKDLYGPQFGNIGKSPKIVPAIKETKKGLFHPWNRRLGFAVILPEAHLDGTSGCVDILHYWSIKEFFELKCNAEDYAKLFNYREV